ncbi:MAG TPA: hypothetical protein VIL17_07945 [Coriobacteriia bacterium]
MRRCTAHSSVASALCREQQRGTKGPSCELVVEKPWRHVRRIDGM